MIPKGDAGLIRKKCTHCGVEVGLAVFGSGSCAMLQLAFLLRETDSERALAKPARFCSFSRRRLRQASKLSVALGASAPDRDNTRCTWLGNLDLEEKRLTFNAVSRASAHKPFYLGRSQLLCDLAQHLVRLADAFNHLHCILSLGFDSDPSDPGDYCSSLCTPAM